MNHDKRLAKLMADSERPLLVTNLTNLRYLTGFTGSNGFLLVGPDGATFITDGRYGEVAAELLEALPATELVVYRSALHEHLASVIGDSDAVRLEAAHVSWEFVRSLEGATNAELVPTTGVVEGYRQLKDGDEIAALQRAAAAGDAVFSMLDALLERAATEGSLGDELIAAMKGAGGEPAGWPPIVATGPNAARPHHRAGNGDVGSGLLLLDYGCVVDGYHSDMTRTVMLGGEADPELEKVYRAVLEANEAGIAAVRPGIEAGVVDEACREVLRSYGYEEYFVHSTGHGVGLDIHEAPSVRRGSEEVLSPGHVITVEPGVYLPGRFGVRIEDMVLVTEHGHTVLTNSSKEMRPQ